VRPANDPSTANDPQIGPQVIPRPEIIPANGVVKKIENGVDSMNSLWMYIFFNWLSEKDSAVNMVKIIA